MRIAPPGLALEREVTHHATGTVTTLPYLALGPKPPNPPTGGVGVSLIRPQPGRSKTLDASASLSVGNRAGAVARRPVRVRRCDSDPRPFLPL